MLAELEKGNARSIAKNILMVPTSNPNLMCFAFVKKERNAGRFPKLDGEQYNFDIWLSLYIQINRKMIGTKVDR